LYDATHVTVPWKVVVVGPVSWDAPNLTGPPAEKTLFVPPETRDWCTFTTGDANLQPLKMP